LLFRDAGGRLIAHFPWRDQDLAAHLVATAESLVLEETVHLRQGSADGTSAPRSGGGSGGASVPSTQTESLRTTFPLTPDNVQLQSLTVLRDGSPYLIFTRPLASDATSAAGTIRPAQTQAGFFSSMRLRSHLQDVLHCPTAAQQQRRHQHELLRLLHGAHALARRRPGWPTMHLLIPRQMLDVRWTPLVLLRMFRRISAVEFAELKGLFREYARLWRWDGRREGFVAVGAAIDETGEAGVTRVSSDASTRARRHPSTSAVRVKRDFLEQTHAVLEQFAVDGGLSEQWQSEVMSRQASRQDEAVVDEGCAHRGYEYSIKAGTDTQSGD
ncbi:hypothetical protein KEM52_001609, partial [Ascosphaera acerosa]